MAPFIVLLATFGITLLAMKVRRGEWAFAWAGRIAMAVMLVFTAVGHFAFAEGMTMMLPEFVPFKKVVVYLTGLMEIAFAIGLVVPRLHVLTAWALITFFIGILPANIHAAAHQVNYQQGTFDGDGLNYLWFRIPLQLLFIVWVYLVAIRNNRSSRLSR